MYKVFWTEYTKNKNKRGKEIIQFFVSHSLANKL